MLVQVQLALRIYAGCPFRLSACGWNSKGRVIGHGYDCLLNGESKNEIRSSSVEHDTCSYAPDNNRCGSALGIKYRCRCDLIEEVGGESIKSAPRHAWAMIF